MIGIRSNNCNLFHLISKWQNAVVFQQDGGFQSYLSSNGDIFRRAYAFFGQFLVDVGIVEQPQVELQLKHMTDSTVNIFFGH